MTTLAILSLVGIAIGFTATTKTQLAVQGAVLVVLAFALQFTIWY